MEIILEYGGRKRKERKKKRNYIIGRKIEIIKVADSQDSVADAEIFRKNTEIV